MNTIRNFCILLLLVLFTGVGASSQIVFSEDFDGIPGATAGGAGTYVFPAGWALRNVDNFTPSGMVSYINEAWERREDFNFNSADSCAFSTSWSSPAGIADDWMWTPMITLPAYCKLSWNAVAYDPAFPDGYEVRIMIGTAPTGGTAAIGNQLTNSTVLFSTAAEASVWTAHTVDLGAYAGQNVYIGFRNNSNDKFVLLIDDILVNVSLNYNAEVTKSDRLSNYTQIPFQQVTPISLTAQIKNKGLQTLTGVKLLANVYDSTHTLVYSDTSAVVANILPDTIKIFDCGTYTPGFIGAHYFEFSPIMDQIDQETANDTVKGSVLISDTTYARDNGVVTGALGIGAGNGGYLGQAYTINTATELRSITFGVNRGYANSKMAFAVWNISSGLPSTIIGTTDSIYYPDDSARIYTLKMHGGSLALAPGDYAFTMIEFDSTLSLAQTSGLFTNGTTWVNWPTSPSGGWANAEYFGTSFSKSFLVRPNLYLCPTMTNVASTNEASCYLCTDGSINITPSGGTPPYTFSWSNGSTDQNISALARGDYYVTITDAYLCSTTDTATIGWSTSGINENESAFSVQPNPNNGTFTIVMESYSGTNGRIEVFNIMGEKVFETDIIGNGGINQQIDLGKIGTGNYSIRISDDQKSYSKRLIIF